MHEHAKKAKSGGMNDSTTRDKQPDPSPFNKPNCLSARASSSTADWDSSRLPSHCKGSLPPPPQEIPPAGPAQL